MIAENPDNIMSDDELQVALKTVMQCLKEDLEKHLQSNTFVLKFNIEIGVPPDKKETIEIYNKLLQNRLDRLTK